MSDFIDEQDEGIEFSDEEIFAVLSSGRTRGVYTTELENFDKSQKKMTQVDLNSPLFAGKEIANVKQGFENAKNSKNLKEAATRPGYWAKVLVKKVSKDGQPDKLFLVNTNLLTNE